VSSSTGTDGAIQPRVARFVDLAHPARLERQNDFIGAEASSGCECRAYFEGTRRFSSSFQFTTIWIWGAGVPVTTDWICEAGPTG
jgi:hypothetical protein